MDSPGPHSTRSLLAVTSTIEADVVRVVIGGEVDMATREELRKGLASLEVGDATEVLVDLSELSFCDGAGSAMLTRFQREAIAAGYDVRFVHASPLMQKVMSLLANR